MPDSGHAAMAKVDAGPGGGHRLVAGRASRGTAAGRAAMARLDAGPVGVNRLFDGTASRRKAGRPVEQRRAGLVARVWSLAEETLLEADPHIRSHDELR